MKKMTALLVMMLIIALSACKLPAPGGGIPTTEATATSSSKSNVVATSTPVKATGGKVEPTSTPSKPLAVTATLAPTQPAAVPPTATATSQPQASNVQAQRVAFKAGSDSATLDGVLSKGEKLVYVLTAQKGQNMQLDVWSPNGDVIVSASGVSTGQALVQAADKKTSWGGILPQDQDYYVSVTAGDGQTSYALTVKISPLATTSQGGSKELFDPYANLGKPTYEDLMVGGSLLEWADAETHKLPDNNSIKLNFKDNKLYVTGKQLDFSTWWFTWHSLKDFFLEMSFDTEQCLGSDAYGMIFRGPEHLAGESYGYVVAFSCDGYYWIFRLDGADPWDATDLVSWVKSDAIKTGAKAENLMAVRAEGKTLTFFANGVQIAQVTDDEFSQGRFGVFVRSSEEGDYTYRVKKVAYWLLGAK